MKVLVTGSNGFLGSYLVEHFLKEGHTVIGVDNMSGGSVDNLAFVKWEAWEPDEFTLSFGENFTFYPYDCRDQDYMNCIMNNVDIVYHCACSPHEGLSVFSPSYVTDSVFGASVSVISAAIANKVKRFIYMSSMARYGKEHIKVIGGDCEDDFYGIVPFEETLECKPVDPYGIAKKASEDVLRTLSEEHGMEYIIAVPHNIIGVRQNYTDPYRNVASIFMNRAKQGLPLNIYGDGSQTRCFSPIDDCLDCLVKLATIDYKTFENDNKVVNIGPDKGAITINDLAFNVGLLAARGNREVIAKFLPPRPLEVKHATCSSDKARRLLDYKEIKSLYECLKEMWEAIPEDGKPFNYNRNLEIITEKTPKTWIK